MNEEVELTDYFTVKELVDLKLPQDALLALTCGDFDTEGEVEVDIKLVITSATPGRPAPMCSNPSSPAYSDPGDSPEMEYNTFLVWFSEDGKPHEVDISCNTSSDHDERYSDAAWEHLNDKAENDFDPPDRDDYDDDYDPRYEP